MPEKLSKSTQQELFVMIFIITAFGRSDQITFGWFIFGKFSNQIYDVSTKEYLEVILIIAMKFDETLSNSFAWTIFNYRFNRSLHQDWMYDQM